MKIMFLFLSMVFLYMEMILCWLFTIIGSIIILKCDLDSLCDGFF